MALSDFFQIKYSTQFVTFFYQLSSLVMTWNNNQYNESIIENLTS